MSRDIFASVNVDRYNWKQCSGGTFRRLPLAGESMWAKRNVVARELYLGVSIRIMQPRTTAYLRASMTSEYLTKSFTSAWMALRHEVPELCLRPVVEAGTTWLDVQMPGASEAKEWAGRTAFVQADVAIDGFERARNILADVDERACLLAQFGAEGGGEISGGYVMIKADHLCMDGIGIRALMGRFLDLLALELDGLIIESDDKDWLGCPKNLTQPWISNLEPEQDLGGPDFEAAVNSHRHIILSQMATNWGIPFQTPPNLKNQQTYFYKFSKESSRSLLHTVKSKHGPSFTITHLGHAATILAILKAQPPESGSSIHSPCWMSGRRHLKPDNRHHIPVCQTVADIEFGSLEELVIGIDATREETKSIVMKATRIANASYTAIPGQQCNLIGIVPVMEDIAGNMPTESKRETVTSPKPQFADPFFLSDGINEKYISHTFNQISNPTHPIITVEDVQFAANAEGPNLIIRLSSWRERLGLSAEWVHGQYEEEFVHCFVDDVARLMMAILEESGE